MYIFFNETYNQRIEKEWQRFIRGEIINGNLLNDQILDSWIRSKRNSVDYRLSLVPRCTPEEIKKRRMHNDTMYQVALPFMKQIHDIIQGSGSFVFLADQQAIIIKIWDDSGDFNRLKNSCREGVNLSEERAGTNAAGTCLYLDRPLRVWGQEHYCIPQKEFADVAAPIHDENENRIGCIGILGALETSHQHTLGIVAAAAKAIENEIRLRNYHRRLETSNHYLKATVESSTSGLIVIDDNGAINQINNAAKRMLRLGNRGIMGKNLRFVFPDKKLMKTILEKEVSNYEISVKNGKISNRYFLSSKPILFKDDTTGKMITLNEMDQVRKLVNKVTASHSRYCFEDIIGASEVIRETVELAKIAANSVSNVLILGESGTGKELFAQSIHSESARRDGPFVSINCGALPKGLIESELFGYEEGAFTGARKGGQLGKFELAHGGTIFLDEVGDMPLDVQVSILRAIQTRKVMRVGGSREIPVDVRIIAATNQNLMEAMKTKTFREDLYYRLNVLQLNVPPLRERKKDIQQLADYFLIEHGDLLGKRGLRINKNGYALLQKYNWPGNVRELENVIERAINIAEPPIITAADFMNYIRSFPKDAQNREAEPAYVGQSPRQPQNVGGSVKVKDLERQLIVDVLLKNSGNIAKTAKEIGLGRRTLYRRLMEYAINYEEYR